MSDELVAFVDTDVLVYAVSTDEPHAGQAYAGIRIENPF